MIFQSSPVMSDLPALRFNDYLQVEGLTPAIQERERTRKTEAPGRELYSRRAKMLIQAGPSDAATAAFVTAPIGMTLEIVPEKNPYSLAQNEPLPVRVIYRGKPLAGALVKLTNLSFDARPLETHLTDPAGRAIFNVPRTGAWLLNVIWTRPLKGDPKADFETTFSSLSFGYTKAPGA